MSGRKFEREGPKTSLIRLGPLLRGFFKVSLMNPSSHRKLMILLRPNLTVVAHEIGARLVWLGIFCNCAVTVLIGSQMVLNEPDLTVSSYYGGESLRIGNEVQLLADDYVIEDRWKLEREVGSVIKHLRNPVLVQDKPWEGRVGTHPCVFYDNQLRKFRMYYSSFHLTNFFNPQDGAPGYSVHYAESEDGFNWSKPALEGFPYGPYPRTRLR
jgi:hypothetical protein